MLGLVGTEAAIDLVAAVLEGAGPALSRFPALLARGADLRHLFLSLIDVLRDATVLAFTGKEELLFRHSPSSLARVRELAGRRSREEWMLLLDVAFRSERDVLATEFPHLGFELLLLRLANAPSLVEVEGLGEGAPAARPQERPAAPVASAPAATFSRKPSPGADAAAVPAPRPVAKAAAGDPAASGLWDTLRRNLEGKKKTLLVGLLSQMEGEVRDGELVISCGHEMVLERLKEKDKWPLLLSALEEAAGRPVPVRLSVSAEKKSPESDAVALADAGLERRALSEPLVLAVLREFEGATLLKVQPSPPDAPGEAVAPADATAGDAGVEGEESPYAEAPAEEE
jgi:DNA polymerase III gamma/tau subunit